MNITITDIIAICGVIILVIRTFVVPGQIDRAEINGTRTEITSTYQKMLQAELQSSAALREEVNRLEILVETLSGTIACLSAQLKEHGIEPEIKKP